jgi:hypothetical protein
MMISLVRRLQSRSIFRVVALAVVVSVTAAAAPARAGLVLSLEPSPTSISAGSTGTFEAILTNTGPGDVDIATFNYQLQISDAAPVSFQGVTDATSIEPYIFGALGFGIGGVLGNDAGFNTLTVSDFLNNFVPPDSPVVLASGASASLGLISVAVDPSATTQDVSVLVNNDINFTFVASTNTGMIIPIAIDSVANGMISIKGTAVPEPSTLVMGLTGLFALTAVVRRKRTRGIAQAS